MSLSLAMGIVAVVNLALGYALALVVEKHERDSLDEDANISPVKITCAESVDEKAYSRHDIPIAAVPVQELSSKEAAVNEGALTTVEPAEMESAAVTTTSSEKLIDEQPIAVRPLNNEANTPRIAEVGEPRATLLDASELEAAILRWWENDPERTRPICVGQIEIDNLRQLTAEHGASAVSGLARQIERLVLSRLRRDDLVASLGRSRFLVMFPNVDADLAADLLEELRREVNDAEFSAEDRMFRTTLTCAVAQAAGNDSVESLLAQAAGALREASTAGRNRVAVHDGQRLSRLTV